MEPYRFLMLFKDFIDQLNTTEALFYSKMNKLVRDRMTKLHISHFDWSANLEDFTIRTPMIYMINVNDIIIY